MNILTVHGWTHSNARYMGLAMSLVKHNVINYNLSGFGGETPKYRHNILDNYVTEIKGHLYNNNYDVIIAHSMGANIILKALDGKKFKGKIILIDPVYSGIGLLKLCTPFMYSMYLLNILPKFITKPILKLVSLFTINEFKYMDNLLFKDIYRADVHTTISTFRDMTKDTFRVINWVNENRVYLIRGKKDRVIPKKTTNLLKRDLGIDDFYLFDCGHSPMLESEDEFLSVIKFIVDGEVMKYESN